MTHVSSDIVEAGRKVGGELVRLTGGNGKLMYIDHAPGVGFAKDLRSGFEEVVEGEPGLDLLPIQYFDLEPQKANTITRTTLTRNPDLAGAFVGVGFGSQGAVPALAAAGQLGKVKTVGFDAFVQNIKFLESGKLDAVVSVAARRYGTRPCARRSTRSTARTCRRRSSRRSACSRRTTSTTRPTRPCLYSGAPQ